MYKVCASVIALIAFATAEEQSLRGAIGEKLNSKLNEKSRDICKNVKKQVVVYLSIKKN